MEKSKAVCTKKFQKRPTGRLWSSSHSWRLLQSRPLGGHTTTSLPLQHVASQSRRRRGGSCGSDNVIKPPPSGVLRSNLQLREELQRRPVRLFWSFLVQTALDFSNSSSCAILSSRTCHTKMSHSYKKNVTRIKKSAPEWVEVVISSELDGLGDVVHAVRSSRADLKLHGAP